MKQLIIIKETEMSILYVLEGYKAGDKAVLVEWNFSTGGETGTHNFADSFAIATVGHLDEDLDFESDVYEKIGTNVNETLSKKMLGKPLQYSTWNPEEGVDDIDWDSLNKWMEDYAMEVL